MKKKCCLIISVIFVLLFSTSIVFARNGDTDAPSEETYTFTEEELHEYVLETVRDDPSNYGMVLEDDYNDLARKQEETLKHMISIDDAFEDTMTGVGITAAIGALACYLIYRKYSE